MEELHKKVIWNAVSAYFMVFVSVFFLFSKSKYINHPFVKSHVKSAVSLHILMWVMLFIMSYPFLRSIHVLWYSLNTIITASVSLSIFAGILYGMYMAHKWKTITLWEMFHSAWVSKNLISTESTQKIGEENALILILAHIPFFGYIIYPRHKNVSHIRDISQINMIITLISVLIFIGGYTSLASLIMLFYIIYSVFQAIRLSIQDEISTLNLDIIPTVEEKYILQKSLFTYVWNNLKKKRFIPLKEIIAEKMLQYQKQEASDEVSLTKKQSFHTRNYIILTILFIISIIIFSWNSSILILFLFPLFYGIWYKERRAYRMPYMYDMYSCFSGIFSKIWQLFHKTRKLQKTQINQTVTMGEQKK